MLHVYYSRKEESVSGGRKELPGSTSHGWQSGVSGLPFEGLADSHPISAPTATETQRDNTSSQHGRSPAQPAQGTVEHQLCVFHSVRQRDMSHKQNYFRIIESDLITDSLIYAKSKCNCTQRPV